MAGRRIGAEALKFATVGVLNVGVDVAAFNLLRTPLGPLAAKAASSAVAITSSYLLNRYWTWADRERTAMLHQYLLFVALSGVGLLIAEACLVVSHYVLAFDSALADNVSANVVGLAAGMIFRFWAYRRWVFLEAAAAPAPAPADQADALVPPED
jgi:putative flippase GtrA